MLIVTTGHGPARCLLAPAGDHPLRGPGLARGARLGFLRREAGQHGAEGHPGERRPARRCLQRPPDVTIPRNVRVPHPLRPARWPACLSPRSPRPPGPASPEADRPRAARRRARAAATGAGGGTATPAGPPPPARPAASSRAGAARRARWCSACSPAGPPTTPGSIPRSRSTPSPPRPAPAPSTSARPSCTCRSCRRAGSSGTRPTAPAASRTGWPNSAAASRRGVGQLEPHHQPAGLRHAGVVGAPGHLPGAGQGRHAWPAPSVTFKLVR